MGTRFLDRDFYPSLGQRKEGEKSKETKNIRAAALRSLSLGGSFLVGKMGGKIGGERSVGRISWWKETRLDSTRGNSCFAV